MDLFYKYFSNHSLHAFKALVFMRSFASTHTRLLSVGWRFSCFCLLWTQLQVLPESLLNLSSGRRHVPWWWPKMEESCLKFLLNEKNPGLLNTAWRTFVLVKKLVLKTSFSHGTSSCTPKINTNIWKGEFPTDNMAEDGYKGTAPVTAVPPNVACRTQWEMPGSVCLVGCASFPR